MILVGRMSLIVVQIKTPKHEENIPWNLLESSEPYWRCRRKTLCVCICKATVFGNEFTSFLETSKLTLTFIQIIDIGLKQRLMKKWNKMHIIIKYLHLPLTFLRWTILDQLALPSMKVNWSRDVVVKRRHG